MNQSEIGRKRESNCQMGCRLNDCLCQMIALYVLAHQHWHGFQVFILPLLLALIHSIDSESRHREARAIA